MKDRSSRITLKTRQIAGRLRMVADYDYVPFLGTNQQIPRMMPKG
jgi:hypothetical protein